MYCTQQTYLMSGMRTLILSNASNTAYDVRATTFTLHNKSILNKTESVTLDFFSFIYKTKYDTPEKQMKVFLNFQRFGCA